MGLYEEAIPFRQQYLTFRGASEEDIAGLADTYATSGSKGYWRWLLDYWTERANRGEFVDPALFSKYHAQLGEEEQAFEWLEKAYQERYNNLFTVKVEPDYESLRDDPRFHDLLGQMNLMEP